MDFFFQYVPVLLKKKVRNVINKSLRLIIKIVPRVISKKLTQIPNSRRKMHS